MGRVGLLVLSLAACGCAQHPSFVDLRRVQLSRVQSTGSYKLLLAGDTDEGSRSAAVPYVVHGVWPAYQAHLFFRNTILTVLWIQVLGP